MGPGLIHHPELLSKPTPRSARRNLSPAIPQSAASAPTYSGARDQDVSTSQYQHYSDTHEPPPHAAPTTERQQSACGAGSLLQPLLLVPNVYDEVTDGMPGGGSQDPSTTAVQGKRNDDDMDIVDALLSLPPKPCPTRRLAREALPPKPSPSRRTPKAPSASAWQDGGQDIGSPRACFSEGGHPAFPPGLIQPAMAAPPPPGLRTQPTYTSPGHQGFQWALL